MKKLLIVAGNIYGGGAERVLVDLINGLSEDEFQITLYTISKADIGKSGINRGVTYRTVYSDISEIHGLSKTLRKIGNKLRFEVYKRFSPKTFYRLFLKGKYDAELAAIEGYATRIVSGSTNPDSVKVAWLHTDLKTNGWSKVAFKSDDEEKAAYKKFSNVVCVTENVKQILFEKYGSDINTCVISNPIRKDNIISLSMRDDVVNEAQEKEEGILKIVFLGRFQQEKGADRLLEAHKRLVGEGKKVQLYMIGDGVQMPEIREYVDRNSLGSSVTLFGYLDNPYPVMKKADLFVCPSRAEGFGLVLVEAMVLDLPVVSTDCAGPNEILEGGKYGLLVENSTDGIYGGIKKFINSPELLNEYSELSKKRREDYGYDCSINKFRKLFNGIV